MTAASTGRYIPPQEQFFLLDLDTITLRTMESTLVLFIYIHSEQIGMFLAIVDNRIGPKWPPRCLDDL